MKTQTLKKSNILRSKIEIEKLFAEGKSLLIKPIRVVYEELEKQEISETKVLFVVSKRFFKSAVDRNRIRRRVKEAFRKNVDWKKVIANENKVLNIALLYQSNKEMNYGEIEEKIVLILQKLAT